MATGAINTGWDIDVSQHRTAVGGAPDLARLREDNNGTYLVDGDGNPVAVGELTVEQAAVMASFPGTEGSNAVTNGTFASDLTAWTGANWSWAAGGAQHTTGSTAALTQGALLSARGTTYKVTFTISSFVAGEVRVYFGGAFGGRRFANGTYTEYFTASATTPAAFTIVPSSTFDGKVSAISVVTVADSGVFDVKSSATFRKRLTLHDGIEIADGAPISIGTNALRYNETGTYNVAASNIAIGYGAGAVASAAQVTVVGYLAGEATTGDGVLTAFGKWAGRANTTGHATFFGNACGRSSTTAQSTGMGDECMGNSTTGTVTAVGYYAGYGNTTGDGVTAFGYRAAYGGGTNSGVTAIGHDSLYNNTSTGATVVGWNAGNVNTSGLITAMGYEAARYNLGGNVCAFGYQAGRQNISGFLTAFGNNAAQLCTTGRPTALGYQACASTTTGFPVSVGYNSAFSNTTGDLIAIGYQAGFGTTSANSPATDTGGILIGRNANRTVPTATVLTNYVGIGDAVVVDKSNQVILGNSSVVETILRGVVKLTTYTVAGLPSAASVGAGASAFVTDASAPVFGSAVTGGGAVGVPVYVDNTPAWRVG